MLINFISQFPLIKFHWDGELGIYYKKWRNGTLKKAGRRSTLYLPAGGGLDGASRPGRRGPPGGKAFVFAAYYRNWVMAGKAITLMKYIQN